MSRLILVGEANPYGVGARGDRLRERLGLSDATYARLTKVNLCTRGWNAGEARSRASDLIALSSGAPPDTVLVLLGSLVRSAFYEARGLDFFAYRHCQQVTFLSLPHPGGRTHIWNQQGARERARSLLRELAPNIPWGETERIVGITPASNRRTTGKVRS